MRRLAVCRIRRAARLEVGDEVTLHPDLRLRLRLRLWLRLHGLLRPVVGPQLLRQLGTQPRLALLQRLHLEKGAGPG